MPSSSSKTTSQTPSTEGSAAASPGTSPSSTAGRNRGAAPRVAENGRLEIPAGTVATYEWLAHRVGNPKAVRAAGSANGSNPISYLIPCHRVIRKSGALGGYEWGLGRKLAMLGLEAAP